MMKTFFGIAVGLILLFSNTMAMPPSLEQSLAVEGAYCAQEKGNNSTFALFSDGAFLVAAVATRVPSPQNCYTFKMMSKLRKAQYHPPLGHYTLDRTHQKIYIHFGYIWPHTHAGVSPCTYNIRNNKIQTISVSIPLSGLSKGVYQRQQ